MAAQAVSAIVEGPKLQEAFDELIRVWSREGPAMMQSNLPLPLDAMNLLANVHVRAEFEWLEERLKVLDNQVSLASDAVRTF